MSSYRFPVYQIDFSAVAAGKRVAATKRRIRWRFGFPNKEALAAGRTGTECRGEEHDITIVWSVTSGKRQIMMDGREVHYSSSRTSILDHSWSTKGSHVLKVVCHAAAPMTANPGFRQYDLFIDGQSFFTMPKVYELGVRGAADSRVPGSPPRGAITAAGDYGRSSYSGPGGDYGRSSYDGAPSRAIGAPSTPAQEEEELQQAINASLEESRRHLGEGGKAAPAAAAEGTSDLLDFAGPSPEVNAPVDAFSSPPPPQQQYPAIQAGPPVAALPPSDYGQAPPPVAYGAPPPQPQQPSPYQSPPPTAGTTNYFAPAPGEVPPDDPFAPKPPSHNELANNILSAYGTPPPAGAGVTPATAPLPTTNGSWYGAQPQPLPPGSAPMPVVQPLPVENGVPPQQQAIQSADPNALTMNGLALTEPKPQNDYEAALQKLVNVDRIDEPAPEQIKLTMKKEEEKAKKSRHSRGLPPVAQNKVGSAATLGQISQVKEHKELTTEGILNAPPNLFGANAAAAGALVVHGQGPPPLEKQAGQVGQGFGVGAILQRQKQMQEQMQQQQQQYGGPPPQQQGYAPQPGYPPQQGYVPQPGYPPQQQAYQYR